MIISEVSQGQKATYSVTGTVLTIGTVTIDLQERQKSVQNVVDVCLDNQLQTMAEGLGAWYVATIVVPPIERELYDTGEVDDQGDPVMAERDLPLDMSKVQLRLWGLPANYGQEQQNEGVEV
ncbi:AAA family ATPase [Paenibacillus naphthalenovorans]|uniref:AAA family ATPase n=1 Tax=Paenibacillus naphthalenovorans TaxID=162209 RepID=UPI003D29E64A